MTQRRDIWTPILIAVVTALIWYWAAGETRVSQSLRMKLRFSVASQEAWGAQPEELRVTVTAEGSQSSIRKAEEQLQELTIDLPANRGTETIDLTEAIRGHPDVLAAGISVVATEPGLANITLDEMVTAQATVVPRLPGVETSDTSVEPSQVTVTMPSRIRRLYGENLAVNAVVDRHELERLAKGVTHSLEQVPLSRSVGLLSGEAVTVTPATVKISFTIKSQISELALATPVRIQIAGPPEDTEYHIELEPRQLRDVTVEAGADVIEQIRSGEAVVVAMLHLKSTEKERRIGRKQVTYFVALLPDGSGTIVSARVGDSTDPPVISLDISERGG